MAECCVGLPLRRRGESLRAAIRSCLPRYVSSPSFVAYWLDYSRRQEANAVCNPPDERRAWAELVKELEGLGC